MKTFFIPESLGQGFENGKATIRGNRADDIEQLNAILFARCNI